MRPIPSFAAILRDAERARFSLDDATFGLVDLDFSRPFFPEALVHASALPFLARGERILVNQLRSNAYLGLTVLAERFILPFVMSQAARWLHGDTERLLALMDYGQGAAKHIALFERFAAAFERGFDTRCEVIGPAEDINARFLTNDNLAVGLLVLHLECLTQTHYVRASRGANTNEHFAQLLRLHWREGAQSAQLAVLILGELAARASQHERARAVHQYLEMLGELSVALRDQIELDLGAFERIARPLTEDERRDWRSEQARSYDEVFLHHGIVHPTVQGAIAEHLGGPFPQLDEAVRRARASAPAAACD